MSHLRIILALTCLFACAPALAATVYESEVSGALSFPPNPVPGQGTATITLNDTHDQLSYVIEFSGLTSPEIAAHFHIGDQRGNGPAVFNLPLGSPKVGVWNIPPQHVTELLNGRLYMNIHTDVYVAGELRANFVTPVVPVEESTWGVIKQLYDAGR